MRRSSAPAYPPPRHLGDRPRHAARTALGIRLDTRPVRWPEEGTQICDPRYDDPHRTPRQNIVVPAPPHTERRLWRGPRPIGGHADRPLGRTRPKRRIGIVATPGEVARDFGDQSAQIEWLRLSPRSARHDQPPLPCLTRTRRPTPDRADLAACESALDRRGTNVWGIPLECTRRDI
jgi:hypothetical protein